MSQKQRGESGADGAAGTRSSSPRGPSLAARRPGQDPASVAQDLSRQQVSSCLTCAAFKAVELIRLRCVEGGPLEEKALWFIEQQSAAGLFQMCWWVQLLQRDYSLLNVHQALVYWVIL